MRPISSTSRVAVLVTAFAWSVAGCGSSSQQSKNAEALDLAGSNLLVITLDTVRADRLGAYGYPRGTTPNLDRLAKRGVRFENAYSPVPLTLPSHSTLFTGLYPFAIGVRINGMHFLREEEVTLAELFKANGYSTGAFVSAYVLLEKFGLAQGFDTYDDSLATEDTLFRFHSETPAEEVSRRFSDWLARQEDRPFFAWLHFYDAHQPYEPPPPFDLKFADNLYDGEIAYVDREVGHVLEALDGHGVTENTVVVVTADHGEAFGEHVEHGHGLLTYDETLRVPFLVVAPGRLAVESVVDTRVGLVDFTPTISELFALSAPAGLQGRSLEPLLPRAVGPAPTGFPPGSVEPALYFESQAGMHEKNWAPRAGVISDGYKYIRLPQPELYDLERDPGELQDLASDHRDRTRALDRQLRNLLLSVGEVPDAERELNAEDRRQLEALGYLSGGGATDRMIDPKRGIQIEMKARNVRDLARTGQLEQAQALLAEVRREFEDVEVIDFYEIDFEIRSQLGDQRGAISALEQGIEKLPLSTIRIKLASYLHLIGRLDDAEREARKILERDPRLSHALSLLGMIAESRGELDHAVEYFERALAQEPRSVPLEIKIAEISAKQGEHLKALAIYDRLDATGDLARNPEQLFKAAAVHSVSGNLSRAAELFERGLAIEPAGKHFIALAVVQLTSGNAASALGNLRTALERYREELEPQEAALAESLLARVTGNQPAP